MSFFRFLVLSSLAYLNFFHGSAFAQSPNIPLNIAYVAVSGTQAGLWVAQGSGLFRKYGLESRFVYIAGGSRVVQSMLGGDIQIAAAAPSSAVDAALSGADLVTVAGMVNVAAFYLVVRPEIKSIQDLRGRPVGITRYGASTDFTLRYLLRKSGLEPDKDVPVLQLGGQIELAAALESGRIVGAITAPPAMVKMENSGGKILVAPRNIGLRFPHVGIVARRSYLQSNRDTVKKFLQAYSEGVALLIRDKETAKKLLQPYVGSADREILESTWKYATDTLERVPHPDPEGIKVVLQDRARTRPEVAKLSPEQFIDGSVIQELEREGFYKKLFAR
jgi:NitT/TauT family transport system substrate-binding protein